MIICVVSQIQILNSFILSAADLPIEVSHLFSLTSQIFTYLMKFIDFIKMVSIRSDQLFTSCVFTTVVLGTWFLN